jgi:NADPH:quinone reductase-like Zn-dependent oxidoreductase
VKAAVYSKTNSGKTLSIVDVERPVPKDDEVLVRTRAASVNPYDWRVKSEQPGVDVAGEVVSAGNRVTQFKAGDAVFGLCKGAFAEYLCGAESVFVSKPANLTFEQAACVPLAGLTALQGLRDKGDLQPGQRVLINGASGGVGTFAVQIAKLLGANVTGVCSARNLEMVRSLGADAAIDYAQEDFTRKRQHYDLLLDNAGNRTFSELRGAVTPHGRCVLVGAPKQMRAAVSRMLRGLLWPSFLHPRIIFFITKVKKEDLAALCEMVKTGKVTPVIDKRFPLSGIADAMAYAMPGHARAKVTISFD